MKRINQIAVVMTLLTSLASQTGWSQIAKCQDAEGKWHYGDNAADVCRESKITVLDKSGLKVKEIDRPPTQAELAAREAERKRREAEEAEAHERAVARERILRVYPNEESIIRARDERLTGIQKNIDLDEKLLDELRLEKNKLEKQGKPKDAKGRAKQAQRLQGIEKDIESYSASISRLRADREKVRRKYKIILEEYRDLTGAGPEKKSATP